MRTELQEFAPADGSAFKRLETQFMSCLAPALARMPVSLQV
jgi:hypothetical protein